MAKPRGGLPNPVYVVNDSPIPTSAPSVEDGGVQTVAIVTGAGTVLVPDESRVSWWIQNLGTNPLYVYLGAGASTTVFSFILKGCTAQDDGSGGFYSDDVYKGTVSVAGTSPRAKTGALNG